MRVIGVLVSLQRMLVSGLMVALRMMLGCFVVCLGGVFVVLGCFLMCVVGHRSPR